MKKLSMSLIATLLLWGCGNQNNSKPEEKVQRVTVISVSRQEIIQPVHTSGRLSSKTEAKLSFKTGGVIDRITVSEGQQVMKGTLMASLNLAEITANKQQAEQAYEKAVRDYERVENLYHDSVATLEHLQNARTAMDVAKSNVDIVEFNYRYSTIEAPFSGKVLLKMAEENEIVGSGHPVFLFGSTDAGWVVRASLTDREIIRVNPGDPARIFFDAYPGDSIPGRVSEVGKAADPYTGTYEVELTVEPGNRELASGFMANVEILPPQADSCLLIPVDVLVEAENHKGTVFVVTDSIARIRSISLRHIGCMICVTGGLAPGERVVLEGAQYLDDGDKVQVVYK
jgi:RND family efflux transporter MFP subunit